VPYEIGIARANGVKILPLLTHPSLDLPGFIANLSYKVSLENLVEFFDEGIRRGSTLELMLKVGHMTIFNEGRSFGMNTLKAEDNQNLSYHLPIYRLAVKNIGLKSIVFEIPLFDLRQASHIFVQGKNLQRLVSISIKQQ
jgi:hypothetical protein